MGKYSIGIVSATEDPVIFNVEVIVTKKSGEPPVDEEVTRFLVPFNSTQDDLTLRRMAEAGFEAYKALQARIKAAENLAREQIKKELPPPP